MCHELKQIIDNLMQCLTYTEMPKKEVLVHLVHVEQDLLHIK